MKGSIIMCHPEACRRISYPKVQPQRHGDNDLTAIFDSVVGQMSRNPNLWFG